MHENTLNIIAMRAPRRTAVPRGQLRKTSVSQQIYDVLRQRILSLELVPGVNLSRAEIAEFYGVSQTPVRDAMLRFEEESLLVIFSQSKTEASRIDLTQARETQFLRMSVEIEVANELAQHAGPKATDTARYLGELFEAAGLEKLWEPISERSGQIDGLRKFNLPVLGKAVEIIEVHAAILNAIQNVIASEAEKQLRIHPSGTLVQVNQIPARYLEFF
jgi:DNA-binding GntR family transcriptional regulator